MRSPRLSVADLAIELRRESSSRVYIQRLDVLDLTANVLKARLHLSPDLFVQVYRNDRFDTTNLALIYGGQRLYGRDELSGIWHRHRASSPAVHDTSAKGRRAVGLAVFLDEVEAVLAARGLP